MKKVFFTLIVLVVIQSICAQTSHYLDPNFNDRDYSLHMEIYSPVSINGAMVINDQNYEDNVYEVGFFVGTVYRGHGFLTYYDGDDYPMLDGPSVFFTNTNEDVYCKLYDHRSGLEYLCLEPLKTNQDGYDYFVDGFYLSFSLYTIDIASYTPHTSSTSAGGWYLIASPLADDVEPTTVVDMLSNDYDLYYFDQTGGDYAKEWINYKASSSSTNPGFKLVPGQGYLYANSEDVILKFYGEQNTNNEVTLLRESTVAHAKMAGWNLIGNSSNKVKTIDRPYFRMNPVGRAELIAGTGNIDAMEGIFVYYDPEDENVANRENKVAFTNSGSKRSEDDDMVLLTLNRNNGGAIDRVIVRFDEGGTLPKYTLRDNSTIIYIPQADRDYAVVKGSATNVFPVNFKTEDFGVYTLSSDIAGANVDYMHLIDKITGEDVDMLLEGEYSFVAAPVDREDRFILRLTYSGYFDNESDIFAYQNGSDIVVCGEGTLQVFDVMGRYVTSYEVNGVQSIQAMPMGVYIFRMLGDDVKTQKIYVR